MRRPRAATRLPVAGVVAGLALTLTAPTSLAAPDGPRDPDGSPSVSTGSPVVGAWDVRPAAGGWRVTWTAPDPLPVVGARPQVVLADRVGDAPAGSVLGEGLVGDDGRTVSLRLPGSTRPDPGSLDVRLGAQVLDEPIADVVRAPTAEGPEVARVATADPGEAGSHRVVTRDYTRPAVVLPGLEDPVEVVGHVEAPADATTRSPLVVLLHGRHTTCHDEAGGADLVWPCPRGWTAVPSHLGFHYLQRRLASQGFVTVSISANGINAQDGRTLDGGATARSSLVQTHLDLWADRVASGRWKADLSRTVLLGHSRGGEGVALAALETPLARPYRVRGVVLLAPTDLARRATPYLPSVTVLPSCDGDVVDLQGQTYTDAAPGLVPGDPALHSSVMLVGANHNFFNSQWTPGPDRAPARDDSWSTSGPCAADAPERLTALEQRVAARTYVAGAVRLLARGATPFLPLYDGSRVSAPSAGDAVVLSHAVGAGRSLRAPGADAEALEPTGGATSQLCRGVAPAGFEERACGRFAEDPFVLPHWPAAPAVVPTRPALELGWTAAGGTGGLRLREPWDVSGSPALDLRTVVDPARGPVRLDVRLTDVAGRSATVPASTLSPLPSGGDSPARLWAQTLRVPLGGAEIDLTRLERVELVARSDQGRVWVLDASATRRSLPAVPARRVPLVDVGSVRLREGDDGTVARIPYTLRGRLGSDAVLRLGGLQPLDGRAVARPTLRLRAGSSSGVLSWPVPANRRDSVERTVTRVTAYGVTGVVAGVATGSVTVLDDDPPPQVRVRAVADRASEGSSLVWVVSWRPPSDYAPIVRQRILPARTGQPAGRADLPADFPPYSEFSLGSPRTVRWVVRVPLRRDGRAEPREVVRVRVAIPQYRWRASLRGVIRASG